MARHWPMLVRPSFVLGGRAMQIVYSDAELQHYMRFAVEASPERPVLVDKFLEDATEVDVDCIADIGHFVYPNQGTIVIGGIVNSYGTNARLGRGPSQRLEPRAGCPERPAAPGHPVASLHRPFSLHPNHLALRHTSVCGFDGTRMLPNPSFMSGICPAASIAGVENI